MGVDGNHCLLVMSHPMLTILFVFTVTMCHSSHRRSMRPWCISLMIASTEKNKSTKESENNPSPFKTDSSPIESKELGQSAMAELSPMQLVIFNMITVSNSASVHVKVQSSLKLKTHFLFLILTIKSI